MGQEDLIFLARPALISRAFNYYAMVPISVQHTQAQVSPFFKFKKDQVITKTDNVSIL